MTKFSRQPISFIKCSFFELFVAKERDDLDSDRRGPLIALGPRPRQCPLEVLEPRVAGALKCSGSPSAHRPALLMEGLQECRASGSGRGAPGSSRPREERSHGSRPRKPFAQDTAPGPLRGFRDLFPLLSPRTAHQNGAALYGCKVARFIYSRCPNRKSTC